ncbi:MAG: Radical protein [Acidimicrobiales bacterium]|nr:Radical protein [Acidimicrobiales bacterium]
MAKALLVNPSSLSTYGTPSGGTAFPFYPVLALASMAGAIVDRGHEVQILDLGHQAYDPDRIASLLRRERPDVIGITATTPLANQLRDISHIAREASPNSFTIGGGPHATALPLITMAQSALDAVAVGEADFTVAHLLDGRDPATIPGLVHRVGHDLVENPAGPLLDDLDELPMPAWQHYPSALSHRMSRVIARHQPVTTVEFSRGCLFRCDFCASKNTMGLGYRKKSPERCAEELVRLGRLGFREAILTDDIFTSDGEWAAAVCEEIIRRDPGVAWTCSNGIRVDSATSDLFPLLLRAGCYRVCFGFESGNDEVLRSFGKGGRATLDQGVAAVRQARAAGLETDGLFMVGLSADTQETMKDTTAYARRMELDAIKCGICVPFPGTPYFDHLHTLGRIKSYDWDSYSVWNDADEIYDHPTLAWQAIRAAFDNFYTQTYLRNPAYLWRRIRFILRHREVWANITFTLEGWRAMRGASRRPHANRYAHESTWRASDLDPGSSIPFRKPPRAGVGGGPQGRDGTVRLSARPARRSTPP